MKYRDVVDIPPPLEQVKQVRDSADEDKARQDVESYVISDRMADQLSSVVLPHLRFDQPGDNRGLFIVGTYGTGKTHLMSVIAAVAEFPDLVDYVTNEEVRSALEPLRGAFKVIRFDIGASGMSLRDIICQELSKGLATMGVNYTFPPFDQVSGTKDDFAKMMGAFEAVNPDSGLIFALDELLDYLRGRRDAELIQDLAFLREVGEASKNTRFRTLIGLQESLFDNPRFAGAADAIRRVKARFEQLRISKEDVSFVVKERLLPKSVDQKERIREHLSNFTTLYDGLVERMNEFVDLFPIHPSYLATFEQLRLVEKREILRTIQEEITRLADVAVPGDKPGVVCIDAYRQRLADDPSARTVPEVQEVLDKSNVVRTKVQTALPETQYVDTATRMIDALAVHRLTTEDVHTSIGLTIEELRDQLLLLPPGLPKRDAVFLRTTVETILAKTLTAVSGQFLSRNDDNGQVFLDLDKDIDYDQLIAQRAESLDRDKLDDAYYVAMEETLGVRDDPYKGSFKTWEYDLPWPDKKSERRGYLFMGAPNQRSTAKPPRDFYLFFIQPYDPPKFIDEEKPDEVLLHLKNPDQDFTATLRRYAGARAMARESTGQRRPIYEQKAQRARQELVEWLRANMKDAITLTHEGDTKTLAEWLHEVPGPATSVKEQLRKVWSHVLDDHFHARFPGYPTFSLEITPKNLMEAVRPALTQLANPSASTSASRHVLNALELLDHEGTIIDTGTYAAGLRATLDAAGGKVVNRSELLTERDPGLRTWAPWHLEPEFLVVVATTLVHLGKAEIAYTGLKIDALALGQLAKMPQDDLVAFTHVAPPASTPTDTLKAAAGLLGLPRGAVPATGATSELVTTFATNATKLLDNISGAEGALIDGIELWGDSLIDLTDERQARVRALKAFAEDIVPRNAIGKLNNFTIADEAMARAADGVKEIAHLDLLRKSAAKLEGATSYLREAVSAFGDDHHLSKDADELRVDILAALHSSPIDTGTIAQRAARADQLRQQFAEAAAAYYRYAFLDAAGERRKRQLLEGKDWQTVQQLSSIALLPHGQFTTLKADLAEIRTLMNIDDRELMKSVIFKGHQPGKVQGPSAEAKLEQIESRLKELRETWVTALADNLTDAELDEQISMLPAEQQHDVSAFRDTGTLPDPVPDELVSAVDQVFRRFDVRHVTPTALSDALFPGGSPATMEEIRTRLDDLLTSLTDGVNPDRTRIVIIEDPTE